MSVEFEEYWGGLVVSENGTLLGHIKIAARKTRLSIRGQWAFQPMGRMMSGEDARAIADKLDKLNGVKP